MVMAATPNPHTTRWFAGLFRECSQSLQQWETLAESRLAECDHLRCTIQTLQRQKRDMAAEKAFNDRLIAEQAALIRDLASNRRGAPALEIRSHDRGPEHVPPRPRTPWPSSTAATSPTVCELDKSVEEAKPIVSPVVIFPVTAAIGRSEDMALNQNWTARKPSVRFWPHLATSASTFPMASKGELAASEQTVDFHHVVDSAANKSAGKKQPARVYMDTHPLHDYEPLRTLVDRVRNATLSSLAHFAKLHHNNLVTPIAFYCVADDVYVVYEDQGEILDWNVETYMEPMVRAANLGYVADEFATLACKVGLESAPMVAAVLARYMMEQSTMIMPPPCSGRSIQTPWSDQVVVMDVLYSLKGSRTVFHGVRAVNTNLQWDWPDIVSLLWVVEQDDDTTLRLAPEWEQPPRISVDKLSCDIELVLGDYQSAAGNTYLAVKWRDHDCPTWEREEDVMAWEFWEHGQHQDKLMYSGVVAECGHSIKRVPDDRKNGDILVNDKGSATKENLSKTLGRPIATKIQMKIQMKTTVYVLLAVLGVSHGHMQMSWPPALRSKFNLHTTDIDYDMTAPLHADGSDFPCKGYHSLLDTQQGVSVVSWEPGQTYNFSLAGTATHGGGSCQASLSFDRGHT
ncbi:hypothetical protein NQ176_g3357 [Zarea fungicola]|uniref:Uncharacterized protein n=1 Tax=Zarea fungicola TaxID=93591 RepID=A0ACC1NL71_9HYPO|nr:hypothetical protein NQ176_g3357 [Lecanicillium fungicola]